MLGRLALVFPGQGSQSVGMGHDLWRHYAVAKETFDEADEALGFSLSRLCFEGPEEDLKRTENTQPAILTTSIAAYRALAAAAGPVAPMLVAGHSFGEYSALVAAGALNFRDALRLVRKRGELMAEALPAGAGTMAAIIGLSDEALARVLVEAGAAGIVQAATLNCPGQVVVAGETKAVAEAGRLALAAGANKVIPLSVSGPFHSSLMRPAADKFAAELDRAEFRPASVPVVANTTARCVTEPAQIKQALYEQVFSAVRWEESVRHMLGAGVETFLELGPGRVLSGLIRRVSRTAKVLNIGDQDSLKEALAILGEV